MHLKRANIIYPISKVFFLNSYLVQFETKTWWLDVLFGTYRQATYKLLFALTAVNFVLKITKRRPKERIGMTSKGFKSSSLNDKNVILQPCRQVHTEHSKACRALMMLFKTMKMNNYFIRKMDLLNLNLSKNLLDIEIESVVPSPQIWLADVTWTLVEC